MSKGIITHFYNEEMLLPHWLKHHVELFDEGILINHRSTDNSVEICREIAPHWKVVDTRLANFDALENDLEVMDLERTMKTDWKMALNVTEFMFCSNLADVLADHGKEYEAIGMRAYFLVDKTPNKPILDPIWKNRTEGFLDDGNVMASRNWRVIHRMEDGKYALGRHFTGHKAICSPEWNILFFMFAPWPEAYNRKMQIQTQIPDSDKQKGYGIQHIQTPYTLLNSYKQLAERAGNLLEDPNFAKHYEAFSK